MDDKQKKKLAKEGLANFLAHAKRWLQQVSRAIMGVEEEGQHHGRATSRHPRLVTIQSKATL